jgi:hypothetical protein
MTFAIREATLAGPANKQSDKLRGFGSSSFMKKTVLTSRSFFPEAHAP